MSVLYEILKMSLNYSIVYQFVFGFVWYNDVRNDSYIVEYKCYGIKNNYSNIKFFNDILEIYIKYVNKYENFFYFLFSKFSVSKNYCF